MDSEEILKTVEINTGFACNCKCKFCSVAESIGGRQKFRDKKEILKEIKEGKRKGAEDIAFLGGDPMLREDIFEIVSFADKVGFDHIMLETNGTMLHYKDICRRLIEAGANSYLISVQGHKPALHDGLLRMRGAFRYMKKGIENLVSLGIDKKNLHADTVLMKPNYPYLEEITALVTDLGVKHLHFISLIPEGRARENYQQLAPKFSEVAGYLRNVLDRYGDREDVYFYIRQFPPCLLQDYEDFLDLNEDLEYYSGSGKKKQESEMLDRKTTSKQCDQCKYKPVCGGVWEEYAIKFGLEELSPVE